MAGQTPSRRHLLQALACASAAAAAPGFVRWSFAFAPPAQHTHQHAAHAAAGRATGPYKPRFFSAAEYATVQVLAELILPRTGPAPTHHHGKVDPAHAGATDAGVAEFIDFMASSDPTLHDPFRNGLLWLDGAAAPSTFRALPAEQQTALLTRLAFRKNFQSADKPGQEFFALMRRYTVMGFYTTEIGLRQLDYPGLQFYGESPAVPKEGPLAQIAREADRA